ncbi:PREDICTED: solute carrier family 25 member 40-like [Acromyrmex echinatior]|uniref:solute carrier family 25 member 40-like n=1 Tax=Acromyrmex echinatior TaxID=103372 RepID=UPI000580F341|nr:PREDICTED: solute carrier family 25 member 40-like [Acromyrmex echinatior]
MNKLINVSSNVDLDDPRFRIKPYQQIVASCTGAFITSVFVTPLDVVKIRLQTQQKAMLSNKCFLYCKGLMDHLCPCTNGKMPDWMKRNGKFNGTFVDTYNRQFKKKGTNVEQPFWIPILAGGTARIWAATLVSPLELIRTKMQSQKLSYAEITQTLKIVVRYSGISGLWMGLSSTLLRDVPFSAIYWLNYETIKRLYSSQQTFTFNLVAGAVAGSIAAFFTIPFDVVKTHRQIEMGEKEIYSDKPIRSSTTWTIIQRIYYQNGLKGLFTGLIPRLVKVAPACAIMIATFEHGKRFFQSYNAKKAIEFEIERDVHLLQHKSNNTK